MSYSEVGRIGEMKGTEPGWTGDRTHRLKIGKQDSFSLKSSIVYGILGRTRALELDGSRWLSVPLVSDMRTGLWTRATGRMQAVADEWFRLETKHM